MHLTKHSINRREFICNIMRCSQKKVVRAKLCFDTVQYITVSLIETFANLKYLTNASPTPRILFILTP